MSKRRVAVVGTRTFHDYALLSTSLSTLFPKIDLIVSGGAQGADALAERYAREHGIVVRIFKPDWQRYGKRAGPIRNALIVDHADYVVAFWDGQSRGTLSSVQLARRQGKPLQIIHYKRTG